MAKGRKPAIEITGRPSVSGGRKPKSPLDDLAKWVAQKGGKQLKNVQHTKRYARGIGWARTFEKSGLADVVEKRIYGRSIKGGKTGSKFVQSSGVRRRSAPKTNADKLAHHKLGMYYRKQDKYARTYGDYYGPHDRFFKEADIGRAPTKEFNKRANAAWNAEVEIGRQHAARTAKANKRALTRTRKTPKKK